MSDSRAIPSAAIEAAIDVLERLAGMSPGEELARAALEASAPHMLAGRPEYGRAQLEKAWNAGVDAGRQWPVDAKSRNPYSPAP